MHPFVSVIIPCYNDEVGIKMTLKSLSYQNYPSDKWELITVDNNSDDRTKNVLFSFKEVIPSLKIEHESIQSSYAARNRGISVSRGDVLAFIDSNMTVNSDWLTQGVSDLVNQHVDYVGCRVNIQYNSSQPSIWERYNKRTGFPVQQYVKRDYFAPTCCLFIRKDILKITGLFDDKLISGGDREFGRRVHAAGFKMNYNYKNVMQHPARSSLKSLIEKYVRVSKGHIDLKLYFPFNFGKINFLFFIRRLWPFQYFPASFKDQKNIELLKMMIVDLIVKATIIKTEFLYYIKRS